MAENLYIDTRGNVTQPVPFTQAVIDGLAVLGVRAWGEGDDLCIEGQPGQAPAQGLVFDSLDDHRLAMTWSLVGLTGTSPVQVARFDAICISYPTFL